MTGRYLQDDSHDISAMIPSASKVRPVKFLCFRGGSLHSIIDRSSFLRQLNKKSFFSQTGVCLPTSKGEINKNQGGAENEVLENADLYGCRCFCCVLDGKRSG
jgi:hypothetical protein